MVFRHDNRQSFLPVQFAHHFIKFTDAFRIQRRGRFIEYQYFRFFRQHRSHHQTLALAAGKGGNLPFLQSVQVNLGQSFF